MSMSMGASGGAGDVTSTASGGHTVPSMSAGSSISVGSMTNGGGPSASPTSPVAPGGSSMPTSHTDGVGAASHTSSSTSSPPTSTAPVCPAYNGRNYTDASGASYAIACGQAYTGTVLPASSGNSNTTNPVGSSYKRQTNDDTAASAQSCMDLCNTRPACMAVALGCTGQCTMYSAITSTAIGDSCATAALKVSAGPAPPTSVVTVSVCGTRRSGVGTTTVLATATLTTCPAANTMCTAPAAPLAAAHANGRLGDGIIGYQGE
ncbi:hypothetical protein LTR36_010194 [Oleoguttula mirabilis]|uniref:Apple domain-containing protein n=1 Tax=Oleoguttula mirabilis TaxID=1507867 RepID=A0AAV9JUS1_9PEZI|nr:hypothetical protein LTR36_010194 [Oleoguttula mirabilis]